MSKEAFEDWNPTPESQARLKQIGAVLADYAGMGITLTLRQLYYQLVSKNIIANKQREYKNLGNLLSRARLAGLVDWDAIEDRVRQAQRASEWDSAEDIMRSAVAGFRLPRWADQPEYVELWCEKDALTSVLEPICDDLHVTLMVNRGYSSSSAMYGSAKRLLRRSGENGPNERPVTVLYLGDFDPSGEDMVRDIRDRLRVFHQDDALDVDVSKLALNPDQIARYKLPPNPAKMSDSRASGFVDRHGSDSYEVDALPPDVLQKMVRAAIEGHMDLDAYREVKAREAEIKAKLLAAGKRIK